MYDTQRTIYHKHGTVQTGDRLEGEKGVVAVAVRQAQPGAAHRRNGPGVRLYEQGRQGHRQGPRRLRRGRPGRRGAQELHRPLQIRPDARHRLRQGGHARSGGGQPRRHGVVRLLHPLVHGPGPQIPPGRTALQGRLPGGVRGHRTQGGGRHRHRGLRRLHLRAVKAHVLAQRTQGR